MRCFISLCFLFLISQFSLNAQNSSSDKKDDVSVFWVTGDCRGDMVKTKINLEMLELLKQRAIQVKPKYIFVNGDLVSGYSKKLQKELTEWRDVFMVPLMKAGIKVYTCRGNHDASEGWVVHKYKKALEVWNKVFSGEYAFPDNGPEGEKNISYYVNDDNIIMFVMDNYVKDNHHRVNYIWMEQVLKSFKKDKYKDRFFVLCHEPAFAAAHKDALESDKKARDAFVKMFLTNGGKYFFAGHDHFYDYATVDTKYGIFHQFICGTAGAPLKGWDGKYSDSRVKQIKHIEKNGYLEVKCSQALCVLNFYVYDKKNKEWKIVDSVKSDTVSAVKSVK